ncbi:MAG: dihydrodipicolinate synthase family protein [Planctomycetota bacterium]
MIHPKLSGLVAATYTPLTEEGCVNTAVIPALTDHLIGEGIQGLYVCGTTGEGMSLSTEERKTVAEAYVDACGGRAPVIVQVGHNSLAEAKRLAEHAGEIGADLISATCPSYFKLDDVVAIVECMAEVAGGCPDIPFYYYHIPALTGSSIDLVTFLQLASERISNLAGLKYTDTKLYEFQECLELDGGRFDVVWGCDEMLLGALATGANAAIGSTYNVAAPLYTKLISAFLAADLSEARRLQSLSVKMIRMLNQFPFHAAMKAVLGIKGFDLGRCRLPQGGLTLDQTQTLQSELQTMGFFQWAGSMGTKHER